jgi:hypothetical protein
VSPSGPWRARGVNRGTAHHLLEDDQRKRLSLRELAAEMNRGDQIGPLGRNLTASLSIVRVLLGNVRVSPCRRECLAGIIDGEAGYDDAYAMSSKISIPGSPTTPAFAIAECKSESAIKASACSTVGKWWVTNTRL